MKKDTIRICFVDFWPNLFQDDNYFYNLLSTKYNVIIDFENPDIVFYSVDYMRRGDIRRYMDKPCKKIYYTGENTLPDWNVADLGFTFDYASHGGKNYRLPLWSLLINWFDRPYIQERDHAYLHDPEYLLNSKKFSGFKNLFCNFVYTQPKARRVTIFPKLTEAFPGMIHSAGSVFNNTGTKLPGRGDTKDKVDYLSNFKFTISFENQQASGYQTEKIFHPMMVGSIPVYWGNPTVKTDFNPDSFINANTMTDEEVIHRMREIHEDDELYQHILSQPWFHDNKFPDFIMPTNVLAKIESIL